MMPSKLTGTLRYQIAKEWLKRKRPMPLEEFIKIVCEHKNIPYKPPQTIKKS